MKTNKKITKDCMPATQSNASPPRFNSNELLNGCNQAIIEHNGENYLLRLTRQGKLILTK